MLDVPLDVIVTRKIGYPVQPELGVGAIAEGGAGPVFDDGLLKRLGLTPEDLADVVAAEEAELARRVRVYRGDRPPPDVTGRGVIVVDDGLATGVTARAALRSLRAAGAGSVVLAVPVAPPSAAQAMRDEADQVVFLVTPPLFSSVGEWYTSFGQLSDADVLALLTPERLFPPRRSHSLRAKASLRSAGLGPRRELPPLRDGNRRGSSLTLAVFPPRQRLARCARPPRRSLTLAQAAFARRMRRRRSAERSSSFRPPHTPYFSGREMA